MAASVFRFGLWLLHWPSQKLALRLSGWIANLLRFMNTSMAQVTRSNLQTCFPDLAPAALRALCQQSLTQLVLLFFEFAQLAYWAEDKLLGQIQTVEGKELLDEAYASGRGVLLLVPHFGNWELLCAFLGTHYSFAALYDPPKIDSFEAVILDARQRFRGELFAINTSGMRNLLRAMQQGKVVAILPDQVPDPKAGVYADFFGQPALTMTLTHRLIVKHQPVVLLGSVQRVPDARGIAYHIRIEGLPQDLAASDADVCAAVINKSIEQVVGRAPSQYQWGYKRFKRPRQKPHKRPASAANKPV